MTPQVGERYKHPDAALASEWTGEVLAPVCPADDVPLAGRDDRGWLICEVCGRRYNEIAEEAQQNAK